jgi:hypothetical protein
MHMQMPSTCFAGRIVIRQDRIGGLDWENPCPIPPEDTIPFHPPWYFCTQHYMVMIEIVWDVLDEMGLVDHDIVAGPPDEFDEMVAQLVQRHGPLERGDPDVQGLGGPGQ